MSYEVWRFLCKNREHGEMEYEGNGDYVCPVCGEEYHDSHFDEDDEDDEYISVSDAADIWMSNGKDEDYMFGYTREELEDAL